MVGARRTPRPGTEAQECRSRRRRRVGPLGLTTLICLSLAAPADSSAPVAAPVARPDGARDFDFEIGRWRTKLRRLAKPLTGASEWVLYSGTTTVTKIWGGKANLVELDVRGPAGRIQALSLRLYNPETREWTLNFASASGGTLAVPTVGGFRGRRGEFYSHEPFGGRTVLVRFVISDMEADSVRFEQAFSTDGGRTWETNWIADDTRLP
jgi:hypothetical protein